MQVSRLKALSSVDTTVIELHGSVRGTAPSTQLVEFLDDLLRLWCPSLLDFLQEPRLQACSGLNTDVIEL